MMKFSRRFDHKMLNSKSTWTTQSSQNILQYSSFSPYNLQNRNNPLFSRRVSLETFEPSHTCPQYTVLLQIIFKNMYTVKDSFGATNKINQILPDVHN